MSGVVGHANGERSMVRVPRMRRCCPCGCGRTSTHGGLGTNGVALMWGCELRVRRWVRDGYTPEMMGWQLGADGFYRKNVVAVLTAEQQGQLVDDVHSGQYTVSDLMQRYPFESEAALNATVERLQESNARPGRPGLRPTR